MHAPPEASAVSADLNRPHGLFESNRVLDRVIA
jgi:hypothetical protein